jgi:hypothetical protein
MNLFDWLVPTVSVLGAVSSGVFALASLLLTRRMHRAETHREISVLYDRLMEVRLANPEVLALSRRWAREDLDRIYDQRAAEDREWARYYSYVELCLGFCNAVIYARSRNLLTQDAYQGQYEPLVKLLLTEHHPILRDLLERGGKFISAPIKALWHELESAGWNWEIEHAALTDSATVRTG